MESLSEWELGFSVVVTVKYHFSLAPYSPGVSMVK